jgi:hypothetical protein
VSAYEVANPDDPEAGGNPIAVSIEEREDPRWHRFAMRLALGSSVTEASHRAGVGKTTGYSWVQLEPVQRLVERYGHEAANRARRELAGMVRQATRTVRELMKDASAKGSPTRLEAAKLVLELTRIDLVPPAQTTRRILTRVPRAGDLSPDTPLPEPVAAQADLPVVPTRDGLPPDFPRHADGSTDLEALSPERWADVSRRTMRRFAPGTGTGIGDGLGPRDPRLPPP